MPRLKAKGTPLSTGVHRVRVNLRPDPKVGRGQANSRDGGEWKNLKKLLTQRTAGFTFMSAIHKGRSHIPAGLRPSANSVSIVRISAQLAHYSVCELYFTESEVITKGFQVG